MEAMPLSEKNAVPVTSEPMTGNGTSVSKSRKIKAAAEKLTHFPEKCRECGQVLHHADMIGVYRGVAFVVKGYHCPNCRHDEGRIIKKGNLRTPVQFDWMRIAVPRSGKYSGNQAVTAS